jgi:hypothetical protein
LRRFDGLFAPVRCGHEIDAQGQSTENAVNVGHGGKILIDQWEAAPMSETKERTYSDEETQQRLKQDLPHWYLENDWIRRKYRTNSWKGSPKRGATRISAGNYGGKLGPHHFHLRDLVP